MNELLETTIEGLVVGYGRLSHDDGDDDESSSIVNQKKIIEDFAISHGMKIDKFYIDDGYSGYLMNRPDFNMLKNDLNSNKVGTIIVKNLSRLGRHNAKVQLFLENIIETGKRVIAIGDNYDTLNENSHDMVGIQTWVNEKYVRDTSKAVKKSIEKMQQEGRYISNVPYGYVLDPFNKGQYYIDETCAMYVKEMFDMYLNGFGTTKIAQSFTNRSIPTNTIITQQRLERRGQSYRGKIVKTWFPNVIGDMLKNDFYIGTLRLGKTKRRSINGKRIFQNEEKLHIFENAHEPIIDKQTFKQVQEMMLERVKDNFRGYKQQRPNIFAGKLYCADCGMKLTSTGGHPINTRYVCRTYNYYGTSHCTSHIVHEKDLTDLLIIFLKSCRENLKEAINDLDNIIKQDTGQGGHTIEILEHDVARMEKEISVLIQQKTKEIIATPMMEETINNMYSKIINEKYIELQALTKQLEDQKKGALNGNEIHNHMSKALSIFDDILSTGKMTKRQVNTIVEKIIVHEDGGLDIFLKGNLHELCTNYIEFKSIDKYKLMQSFIEYIKANPNCVMRSKADQYVRAQGNKVGKDNFRRIFQILVEKGYLTPNPGYHQGYRVIELDKLISETEANNVRDNTPRMHTNNVTIVLIHKICAWISTLNNKKKNLF